MAQEEVGKVSHFFTKIGVAAVITTKKVSVGDSLYFKGATTDFTSTLETMQIKHESVESAGAGSGVGISVAERVRAGDIVYRLNFQRKSARLQES